MEEQKQNQENPFIKEKIKNKPINKRRLAYKILGAVFSGILFGFAACVTFVAVKPKLEKMTEKPQDTTVTFPRDDEQPDHLPDQEEPNNQNDPDTQEDPDGQGDPDNQGDQDDPEDPNNGNQTQDDPQMNQPQTIVEKVELKLTDWQALQSRLYAVGKTANRSIVTVTGVTNNTDWFESAYESESQTSGIIIADNGTELLILTEKKAIINAEKLSVTFINGDIAAATLKKYDGNTGIAVISVALEEISQDTMDKIQVCVLGNSYTVTQGTVVIAVGSPLGYNYSILYGTVTSSENTVSTWDSTYTVFSTDIMGSAQGSGVLINLEGKVVGLVMQDYSSKGDQNTITALSISQLKGIIENLSNGKAIPYLGLKISTVTDTISKKYGLPQGVYVKSVETDMASPGMLAGIQEGDIITRINGEAVQTTEQYTNVLHSLSPQQTVKILLLRQNGEEYVELECTAIVGVMQ